MDLRWKSKIAAFVFGFVVLLLLTSCGASSKTTTTLKNNTNTTEIIEMENPYKLSVVGKIKYDRNGKVEPLKLNLRHDEVVSEVIIKDDEVLSTLENKDTIVVSKEKVINTLKEDITVTETVKPERTGISLWWRKFKNRVLWISLAINAIVVLRVVLRIYRKVALPI